MELAHLSGHPNRHRCVPDEYDPRLINILIYYKQLRRLIWEALDVRDPAAIKRSPTLKALGIFEE
jgi:hypothetical protein